MRVITNKHGGFFRRPIYKWWIFQQAMWLMTPECFTIEEEETFDDSKHDKIMGDNRIVHQGIFLEVKPRI